MSVTRGIDTTSNVRTRPEQSVGSGEIPPATNQTLAEELLRMTDEDRRLQQDAQGDDYAAQLAYRRVTTRNADRLNEIMDEYGWPTVSLVGKEPARRAWLIAQHADRQLDVQRRALGLMERAVAAGEASLSQLASLNDRVLVNEGHRQVYGTQIAGIRDGAFVPWPCEDPEGLDRRRAEVGLEPFAAHAARFSATDPYRSPA